MLYYVNSTPNPSGLFSIAALMHYYNKIRIKFTKHNWGRQKLTNVYTLIQLQVFKTILATSKISCNQKTQE